MHQFSRDAGVAEAWLLGQEPYLSSREMGQSVDEVEKLIKRHEAFEKSAATWEERFSALERLTTVSTEERNTSRSLNAPPTQPANQELGSDLSHGATLLLCHHLYNVCVCVFDQLELLEVRRQQEEEERMRKPATPEPCLLQEESQQQR